MNESTSLGGARTQEENRMQYQGSPQMSAEIGREASRRRIAGEAEEFLTRLGVNGRNAGPSMLANVYLSGALGDRFVEFSRIVLPTVWRRAEWPTRAIRPTRIWVEWFRSCGFVTDDADLLAAPTGPLTIYRGATWACRRGMSWTTDHEVATWFAERFGRHAGIARFESAYIFTATVEPQCVLAMFQRSEHEVVVDPRLLPSLKKHGAEEIIPSAKRAPEHEARR